MLIDRAVFDEAGGWDEGAFAYYEDVELGWRLHVLGHGVWLAPRAVVHHKHHGTSGAWPEPPRMRLYERNSLRNPFCLLEADRSARALSAALLLAADRALLETGLSRAADTNGISKSAVRTESTPGPPVEERRQGRVRARGISRSTPIAQALGRVWQQGVVNLGQRRDAPGPHRNRARAASRT